MAAGSLRAVVATSTLDLGIDWGDVDLVIHVGAPKGASRAGCSASAAPTTAWTSRRKAILVPANRFEVLECRAALDANYLGAPGHAAAARPARSTCWPSTCSAWPAPRRSTPTSSTPRCAAPRPIASSTAQTSTRRRFRRDRRLRAAQPTSATPSIRPGPSDGHLAHRPSARRPAIPAECRHHRRDADAQGAAARRQRRPGTVRRAAGRCSARSRSISSRRCRRRHLPVRRRGAALRGHPRERGLRLARDADDPKIPSYAGGKFPLSTYLAEPGARACWPTRRAGSACPSRCATGWRCSRRSSRAAAAATSCWSRPSRAATASTWSAYPFEGRLAHQTLGMLLTRRLERAGAAAARLRRHRLFARRLGAAATVGAVPTPDKPSLDALFDEDMLGDDLEAWLAESWHAEAHLPQCAMISGLIERRHPGKEKTGRQVTVVLRPRSTTCCAATSPTTSSLQAAAARCGARAARCREAGRHALAHRGQIVHKALERISPLAVPIMLEIGKTPIYGRGPRKRHGRRGGRTDRRSNGKQKARS